MYFGPTSIRYTQYQDAKNSAIPANSGLIENKPIKVVTTITKDATI